ncbi:hypothetical protein Q3G72_028583 [Acer saccharum]|nr:hypothetical protein Q3G72_028583 [Acer saccharum]
MVAMELHLQMECLSDKAPSTDSNDGEPSQMKLNRVKKRQEKIYDLVHDNTATDPNSRSLWRSKFGSRKWSTNPSQMVAMELHLQMECLSDKAPSTDSNDGEPS